MKNSAFALILALALALSSCREDADFKAYAVKATGECVQIQDGAIVAGAELAAKFNSGELESIAVVHIADNGTDAPTITECEFSRAGDSYKLSGGLETELALEITDIIVKG